MQKKYLLKTDNVEMGYLVKEDGLWSGKLYPMSCELPNGTAGFIQIALQNGVYDLSDSLVRSFLDIRIVPPNRQNIGVILSDIGLDHYEDDLILDYTKGATSFDDTLIVPYE